MGSVGVSSTRWVGSKVARHYTEDLVAGTRVRKRWRLARRVARAECDSVVARDRCYRQPCTGYSVRVMWWETLQL